MASIDIPAEALTGLISKSILDVIGPEQRDALITSAITKLIQPGKSMYGREEPSELQNIFDNAVGVACQRVVRDLLLENDEWNAMLRSAVTEKMQELFEHSGTVDRLVREALVDAMVRRETERSY